MSNVMMFTDPLVGNICVYADQSQVKPIGIIVPVPNFLQQLGFQEDTDYNNNKLTQKVVDSLNQTGRSQGLKGIELLQNVVLVHDEWTPENNFVSSAQKLQRKKIVKEYEKQIEKAYQ